MNSGKGGGGGPRGWRSVRILLMRGFKADRAVRAILPRLID